MIVLVDGAPGSHVPVVDRGFSYGDGVFEVLLAEDRRVRARDLHLARLVRSAELVGFDAAPHVGPLRRDIARVVRALPGRVYVRVVLTRGDGLGVDAPPSAPRRVVIAASVVDAPPLALRAITVDGHPSPVPGAKTLSYIGHVLHRAAARSRGAHEAIVVEHGLVREAAGANVIAVVAGVLRAPIERALPGITRSLVLGLARGMELEIDEGPLTAVELASATEVLLTSTIRGIASVSDVDDRPLPDATPAHDRLAAAYASFLAAHMAEDDENTEESATLCGAE